MAGADVARPKETNGGPIRQSQQSGKFQRFLFSFTTLSVTMCGSLGVHIEQERMSEGFADQAGFDWWGALVVLIEGNIEYRIYIGELIYAAGREASGCVKAPQDKFLVLGCLSKFDRPEWRRDGVEEEVSGPLRRLTWWYMPRHSDDGKEIRKTRGEGKEPARRARVLRGGTSCTCCRCWPHSYGTAGTRYVLYLDKLALSLPKYRPKWRGKRLLQRLMDRIFPFGVKFTSYSPQTSNFSSITSEAKKNQKIKNPSGPVTPGAGPGDFSARKPVRWAKDLVNWTRTGGCG